MAWMVGMDDWSSASPSSSFTRHRNWFPAEPWSRRLSYTSGRFENLDTEKNMALSRSFEKYGPAHAMSLVNTAVPVSRGPVPGRFAYEGGTRP